MNAFYIIQLIISIIFLIYFAYEDHFKGKVKSNHLIIFLGTCMNLYAGILLALMSLLEEKIKIGFADSIIIIGLLFLLTPLQYILFGGMIAVYAICAFIFARQTLKKPIRFIPIILGSVVGAITLSILVG